MSTAGIQGVVNQMRALAAQAGGAPDKAQPAAGTAGFGLALKTSIEKINDLQQSASGEARAFQTGKPGVELYQVMVDTQQANLAFQMGVQVRNRLVSAYKEVMNMQV